MVKTALNVLANSLTRRRYLRIILLPFVAPIFFIGWILVCLGKEKPTVKRRPLTAAKPAKDDAIEVGVLNEMEDELSLLEQRSKKGSAQ